MQNKLYFTGREFIFNVLNGVAVGIVIGLMPNAILGGLFKYLGQYNEIFFTLSNVVQGIQFTTPVIVGVLIAMQFGLSSMQTVIAGTAGFVGSGAAIFLEKQWVLVGIGDIINTMITVSIAVYIMILIGDKLGSLTIIMLPIIAGGISGSIGLTLLPYTKLITQGMGTVVNSVSNTQPIIMSVLIAMIYSVLIISPVSAVAIGIAIGISGLASGAAGVGVTATAMLLIVGTWKVNGKGVPAAVLLGAIKIMMSNMIRNPIMLVPIVSSAATSGLVSGLLQIKGSPETAGFGIVGLISPIKAMELMQGNFIKELVSVFIAFICVPFVSAIVTHYLTKKFSKSYSNEIFIYNTIKN